MKASDDLFQLIKCLTKNEKGYFKKTSSLHTIGEQNKYLVLFNVIESQKEYDEAAIKKRFAGEPFVRQLHVAKNYLFHQILSSCEQYQTSINARLKSLLIQVEFLMDKELFKPCEKLLKKAMQIALRYEKHAVLMDIFMLKKNLIRKLKYTSKSPVEMETLFQEELSLLKKYTNLVEYSHLTARMYMSYSKEGMKFRTQSEKAYFQNIIKDPLFSGKKMALSLTAQMSFCLAKGSYYSSLGNHRKSYIYIKRIVEIYEENTHFIEESPLGYQGTLRNLISCLTNLQKHQEIYPHLDKLRQIGSKSKSLTRENFYFINFISLVIHINSGEFTEGIKLINGLQKEIYFRKSEPVLESYVIQFDFCFAYIFFGAGNYKEANRFLNKIINSPVNLRSDLYCFALILRIVVHYETGKNDLMEHAVKAAYRFLYKKRKLFVFEKLLLDFIEKKLILIQSNKSMLKAFSELNREIKRIEKEQGNVVNEYFDFSSWLESKIENRSFAEIVKSKAENRLQTR